MHEGAPVFLADDSAVARLALVRALRSAGFEVVERASVAASASVDAAGIACALLDLELEDGTGTDIAGRLRAARPELPIAFFSSVPAPDLLAHAETFGPVFAKPEQLDDAVAWVRAAAQRGGGGGGRSPTHTPTSSRM